MKDLELLRNDIAYFLIRLGGFHTRMSFRRCIGYIMSIRKMGNV